MGFPTLWQSQTTAFRISFGVHSQGPTIHGATLLVRSEADISSVKKVMLSCIWRKEAGHEGSMSPSTIRFTTAALSSPQAIRIILLALIIVPTPIVMADLGVTETSPLKLRD